MQTYSQTVAGAQTIQLNVTGRYFTILLTALGLNVRFFKNSKKKDLGDIKALLSGLEVWFEAGDEFDRVEIDTLGADTVTIGIGNGQARYNRSQGNVAIQNIPHVIVDTLPKVILDGLTYGLSYKSNTVILANAPDTIFTPAANINGAIIHSAQFWSNSTAAHTTPSIIAKASAPASVIDGDVILSCDNSAIMASNFSNGGRLIQPVKIAAGKGLYFITAANETVTLRNVLYTLL